MRIARSNFLIARARINVSASSSSGFAVVNFEERIKIPRHVIARAFLRSVKEVTVPRIY